MEVVYFELNNWFAGRDYPIGEPFESWLCNDLKQTLCNEEWVKENKLVVVCGNLDMSMNYCISAPREWVEENCPDLLTDKSYEYKIIQYHAGEEKTIVHTGFYKDFLRFPLSSSEEYEDLPEGRYGMNFLEYNEDNIGVHWLVDYPVYDDDDEDED